MRDPQTLLALLFAAALVVVLYAVDFAPFEPEVVVIQLVAWFGGGLAYRYFLG